jgi:hypothetical protein
VIAVGMGKPMGFAMGKGMGKGVGIQNLTHHKTHTLEGLPTKIVAEIVIILDSKIGLKLA